MKTTLNSITEQMLSLMAEVEASGGELTPELKAAIDAVEIGEGEKADAYFAVIQRMETEMAQAKKFANYYESLKDSYAASIEHAKGRIFRHMKTTGQTEIRTPMLRKFSIVKNGGNPKVIIAEGTKIDDVADKFLRVTKAINKEAVLLAIKSGEKVEWATLEEPGESLRIAGSSEAKKKKLAAE